MAKVKDLETENLELELELEVIKRRLLDLDPVFQKYTETFKTLAEQIKALDRSPLQVFEEFDENRNGLIDKVEFQELLQGMSIHIDKQELDILFLYIDIDGSGSIEYKEFCRRLKRAGVVVRK